MPSLWTELKRRKVVRMALAYCALAWLLLQVTDLVLPLFEVPGWVMRLLVLLLVLGFPFALLFSWGYAWTDQGLTRELPSDTTASAPLAAPAPLPGNGQEAPPRPASIAVLPLVNMSSDREQDYFSDGLSEELLNLLAQVPGLHVAGRTSSFSFKDKACTISDIGRSLHVATVLEGSVRKAGNHIRITAQLIKTEDGYHLWSQTYDRELDDIFAMQDEIAAAVVDTLKQHLLPMHPPSTTDHHRPGQEAYNDFLLGRHLLNRATEDSFKRAVQAFSRAVAQEPDYAAAWAGLALAEAYAADFTESEATLRAGRRRAAEAADRAVTLDPGLAEAHTARAVLRFVFDLNWAGGEADFRKALECNPGDVMTLWQYSRLQAALGRLQDARQTARQATRLDPLSAQAWEILSRYQMALGELADARHALTQALDIDPEHGRAPVGLGMLALLEGDADGAMAWHARTRNATFRCMGMAMAAYSQGNDAYSRQLHQDLMQEHAHDSAYQVAEVFAWRGEHDAAFDWLQRAVRQHDAGVQYLKYDPALRTLRHDPRFALLLAQVGLST